MESNNFLSRLGIYGWDDLAIVVLAALSFEETILLKGETGTAKSLVFDKIMDKLWIKKRKYNASMVNLDDLIGIPMPNWRRTKINYIQGNASVWGAGAIFIDEINRCKPELQNKLFPLIYDKEIQGVKLRSLRYRWAAMNEVEEGDGDYLGAEPLDKALEDRFVYAIKVPTYRELSLEDRQYAVSNSLEGVEWQNRNWGSYAVERKKKKYSFNSCFDYHVETIARCKLKFQSICEKLKPFATSYAMTLASFLLEADIEISTRRVNYLAKTILELYAAAMAMDEDGEETTFETAARLQAYHCFPGLPGDIKLREKIASFAVEAVKSVLARQDKQIRQFLSITEPAEKIIYAIAKRDNLTRTDIYQTILQNLSFVNRYQRRVLSYLAYRALRTRPNATLNFFEALRPDLQFCLPIQSKICGGGCIPLGYRESREILKSLDPKTDFSKAANDLINSFFFDGKGFTVANDVHYVFELLKKYYPQVIGGN